ncbi:MAG: protein tyrosine phosphatase, partial [Pseudomonas sp.]|nr:protein tyrosine phosphatase [Pseudomonas sp.]
MFKNQLLPAVSLVFMALFTTAPSQAEELTPIRSLEWAQPVGNQYNLYQMTPTLYRSALPDSGAVPVLEKLKIGTVINFLPESDAKWLKSPGINQVQLSYRTNHVDDADVLAALRAIQDAEANG